MGRKKERREEIQREFVKIHMNRALGEAPIEVFSNSTFQCFQQLQGLPWDC
jgi:hypothetical protein